MLPLFLASLALILTIGYHETAVLESGIESTYTSSTVYPSYTSSKDYETGSNVINNSGPIVIGKVIPGAVVSKLASKLDAIKSNQVVTTPLPKAPIVLNVPDCFLAIPLMFKDGVKYVAVKSRNILEKKLSVNEAMLTKIRKNLLTAVKNLKRKPVTIGRILLKPVVIIGARKGSIIGKKIKTVGSAIDLVGDKVTGIANSIRNKGELLHSKSENALLKNKAGVRVIPTQNNLGLSIPVVEVLSSDESLESYTFNETIYSNDSQNEAELDRSERSTDEEHVKFGDLLKIVGSLSLQDCVLRVICELNCDSEAFGKGGSTVYNTLVRFEVSGAAKGEDSLIYREAALKGRNLRKPPKECVKCSESFTNCNATSTDLIRIASRIQFH